MNTLLYIYCTHQVILCFTLHINYGYYYYYYFYCQFIIVIYTHLFIICWLRVSIRLYLTTYLFVFITYLYIYIVLLPLSITAISIIIFQCLFPVKLSGYSFPSPLVSVLFCPQVSNCKQIHSCFFLLFLMPVYVCVCAQALIVLCTQKGNRSKKCNLHLFTIVNILQ